MTLKKDNSMIKSYDISKSPNLEQINRMLNIAFTENINLDGLMMLFILRNI